LQGQGSFDIRQTKLIDGSIRYRATFSHGSGKNRKRYSKTFAKKSEARLWLHEQQADFLNGYSIYAADKNFPDAFWNWVLEFKGHQIKETTMYTYGVTYRHLKIEMPEVKMKDLSRQFFQETFNRWADEYSIATLQKWRAQIGAFLKEAVLDGGLKSNPMEGVKLPTNWREPDGSMKALSISNYKKTIDFLYDRPIQDDSAYAMVLLVSALTGFRPGESRALRPNDLDVFNNQLRVDETYSDLGKEATSPKTPSSKRWVKVPDRLMHKIQEWQRYSREMRFRLKIRKNEDFLFILPNGNIPTSSMLGYNFLKIQRQAGIDRRDYISPHGLRHTFTSFMLSPQGGNQPIQYVSKVLGHADTAITQSVYFHLLREDADRAADEVVRRLDAL
jgi:integrase